MAPRLLEPFQLAQRSFSLLSCLCPSPASGSFVHCLSVLAGQNEPMQSGRACRVCCAFQNYLAHCTFSEMSPLHRPCSNLQILWTNGGKKLLVPKDFWMLSLPQAPQTWGESSVLSIHGGSRLPSGSPPSAGPPGHLAMSGPSRNGRGVQGDRWQLCQPDNSSDLHTAPGAGEKVQGMLCLSQQAAMAVALTQDHLTEHPKYFISYLWISFLSQIVPDRMLFHLLKIWGSCPPLLETVLLPLIPEEL